MKKVYLVVGGEVTSQTDGDTHFIPARRLVQLYGLDPKDCVLIQDVDALILYLKGRRENDYIVLHPRQDGNYRGIR